MEEINLMDVIRYLKGGWRVFTKIGTEYVEATKVAWTLGGNCQLNNLLKAKFYIKK